MADNRTQVRVVVGVDFGTTFSGFAYAHKSDPDNIHTFYEWPMQLKGGGKPYCKTQTSLYYVPATGNNNNGGGRSGGGGQSVGGALRRALHNLAADGSGSNSGSSSDGKYELKEWAWPAQVKYLDDLQAKNRAQTGGGGGGSNVNGDLEFLLPSASRRQQKQNYYGLGAPPPAVADAGYFVRRFKLHLAGPQDDGGDEDGDDGKEGGSSSSKKKDGGHRRQQQTSSEQQQQRQRRRGVMRRMLARVTGAFTGMRPRDRERQAGVATSSSSKSGGGKGELQTPLVEAEELVDTVAAEKKAAVEAFKAAQWVQQQQATAPPNPNQYSVFNDLPPGMSVERAISDYLEKLSEFAVAHLQATYGAHMSKREVQWCLTVPAMWDDWAKQRMRLCAQRAGMVTGPDCPRELAPGASPHPLIVVLESEAASVYCSRRCKQLALKRGDQFLVADVGGGTVDIVVHTMDCDSGAGDQLRLREVRQSMGGLCGGTYVDKKFVNHLADRIPVFVDFIGAHPAAITPLLRRWEEIKCGFDGAPAWGSAALELPRKLSAAWEEHDGRYMNKDKLPPGAFNYDEVELTDADMRAIFDPVVDHILELVRHHMSDDIKLLMLVGGFSASPYLARRVRAAFASQVADIVNPPDPGSAICQGAVTLGLFPEIVMSRVSRKTYGINQYVPFKAGLHPKSSLVTVDGVNYCSTAFTTYVRRGEAVEFDQVVTRANFPVRKGQRTLTIQIYSSDDRCPAYITDPGVRLEGSFVIDISHDPQNRDLHREVHVSMFFGKSCIQLNARRMNFGNTTEVVEMHDSLGFDYSAGFQDD